MPIEAKKVKRASIKKAITIKISTTLDEAVKSAVAAFQTRLITPSKMPKTTIRTRVGTQRTPTAQSQFPRRAVLACSFSSFLVFTICSFIAFLVKKL